MAGRGVFQLVLHGLEKELRLLALAVIIDGQSENITHLGIEPFFAGTDVADPFKQLVEVIRAELLGVAQALVVEHKALSHILGQNPAGPAPEMNTDIAAHPIADCQDPIEVIVIPLPFDLARALHLNCSEYPNSCFFIQLAVLIYVADVFTDRRFGNLVQVAHRPLRHCVCQEIIAVKGPRKVQW